MTRALHLSALAALLLTGAIFGFFYAWVCSTMWGLDAAPPEVAVSAMQHMNASVRNAVFAPAFLATPIVILIAAAVAWAAHRRDVASLLAAACTLYLAGAFAVTLAGNVPLNEALAAAGQVADPGQAAALWADYSPAWQTPNITRTVSCGVSLMLTGVALIRL